MENNSCIKGHSNPPGALYCRICGAPIASKNQAFTPELYPTIHLVPCTVKKIKFVKSIEVFSMLFVSLFIIAAAIVMTFFRKEMAALFENMVEEEMYGVFVILFFVAVLILISAFRGVAHLGSSIVYNRNAEFIEEASGRIVRIAKKGKLGLFNQEKKKLLLFPFYDKLEAFDSNHYLMGKGRFLGLYSIPNKRVIIPAKCDSISPEKDGIFLTTIKGEPHYYDINGNVLH